MFDIKQWLSEAPKNHDFETTIGKDKFKLRCPDGLQREKYNSIQKDSQSNESGRAFLLSCCLIDDRTGEPVKYSDALEFVKKFDLMSQRIETKILVATGEILQAEAVEWETAEKNSKTTDTK